MDEFWVFGYGSLMWNPGFKSHRRVHARLSGYHRSLCIRSFVHRGTAEAPGLVLGLDRGGFCEGLAFAVKGNDEDTVMAYLRERELVTNVYRELVLPVRLPSGEHVPAVCYVVDRAHAQYAGAVDVEKAATIVKNAHGQAGPNRDYVLNTARHLREMDIEDAALEAVAALLTNEDPRPVKRNSGA
ncbi:gamma-glutamylcyclotransferase [Martelella endophytica]|uniref:glutathione-specific gamma-glutamylcyclotransferase n=1 Tax=Martelella endophytica TaxID=1486262 RepID=A0A0D5LTH2_MAREN|nr:gamma-glutamylcyclotransferase [Martelella endophytica]AJY47494.1 gamma-glutamyl cyclotransferase [Martelella endophytica]